MNLDEILRDRDREVIERLVTGDHDIVYVSGSRVERIGNAHSDLDFFIVTPTEIDLLQQPVFQRNYYIDCEYYSLHEMEALAEELNSVDRLGDCAHISDDSIDLYYRTAIGIPVKQSDRFYALQTRFNKSIAASVFGQLAANRSIRNFSEATVDLLLGDQLTALFRSRCAAEWATNAFLARHGEAYPGTKWRFEKAERRFGLLSPEYKRMWDVRNIGDRSVEDYLTVVGEFLTWCEVPLQQPPTAEHVLISRDPSVKEGYVGADAILVDADGFVCRLGPVNTAIWKDIEEPILRDTLVERLIEEGVVHPADYASVVVYTLVARLHGRGLVQLKTHASKAQ